MIFPERTINNLKKVLTQKDDSIESVMKRNNLSYSDAVVFALEAYGLKKPYLQGKSNNTLFQLNAEIQENLSHFLNSSKHHEKKKYIIDTRKITEKDVAFFGFGYVPFGMDFSELLTKYPKELWCQSGFFKEDKHGRIISRFTNRITIPIKDIEGNVIGFAGRSVVESNMIPKYINSPDSPIFHKGETLFNLNNLKIDNKPTEIVLAEGYFDVIRLNSIGVENVVAPMGTGFTLKQAALLKLYSNNITVMFDGDLAGIKAAFRTLMLFLSLEIYPKVIFLPTGEDPDSFFLKHGLEVWEQLNETKEDLLIALAKHMMMFSWGNHNKTQGCLVIINDIINSIDEFYIRDYYKKIVEDIFN